MTDIYIFSGFLGAGKTTLIQKLLMKNFSAQNTVLIENDFGTIDVDAELLKSSGFRIHAINSGCICCTLVGDFVKSIEEVVEQYHPNTILVEPSGVGKLSAVEHACRNVQLAGKVRICGQITVVDVKRCCSYLRNFSEFFKDQVKAADILFLSRSDAFPDKISDTKQCLKKENPNAQFFTSVDELLAYLLANRLPKTKDTESALNCEVHYKCCHHSEDESFQTITIQFQHPIDLTKLRSVFQWLERKQLKGLLRAKGVLNVGKDYFSLQYVPGEFLTEPTTAVGNYLCLIGRTLDRQAIAKAFHGEQIL